MRICSCAAAIVVTMSGPRLYRVQAAEATQGACAYLRTSTTWIFRYSGFRPAGGSKRWLARLLFSPGSAALAAWCAAGRATVPRQTIGSYATLLHSNQQTTYKRVLIAGSPMLLLLLPSAPACLESRTCRTLRAFSRLRHWSAGSRMAA
jgi:hypothetical protein